MAKHSVTYHSPEAELGNADLEFEVKQDGGKIGTLKVSKGALVWVPKNKSYGYRVQWSRMGELIEQHGAPEARPVRRVG